jgi:hypothetical protein
MMTTEMNKIDEALETALQMPARTERERFQRAVSVANVRYWYLTLSGHEHGSCRILDETFNVMQ